MEIQNEIPRRAKKWLWHIAEIIIYNAMQEVEKMGADERLTDAVCYLQKAKDSVADYIDGVNSNKDIGQNVFTKEEEDLVKKRYPDLFLTKDRNQFYCSTNQGFGYVFIDKKKDKIRYYSHTPSDVDTDTGKVNSYHNFEMEYNSIEDYIRGNGVVITDEHKH